jgi:Tfp pilus assembly protein PilF
MYQREGDNARALPYFEEAHRLDPDNGGVIEMLGQAYLHTHAYALADQVYRKALSRFSVYPPFNTGMAQVFETKIGGTDSALYYFHRALNTAPEYVPAIEGLARLFMKSHSLDSALYYYDMLSRYLPPNRDLEMRKQKLRQQIAAEKNNGQ